MTERVVCCVCGVPGERVYDVEPLGVVRCPRCSLVFVSPRLSPAELQELYDAPAYHDGVYGTRLARWLQAQWTAGRLSLATGRRWLEIGAGHGGFLAAARTRGYVVTGVELSVTAAEHARTTYGLDVHGCALDDAPVTGPFDVICAWDTVEHVPDPVAFWRSVRSLLAPDGVVLFSTPYFSSVPSRVLRSRWWTLKPAEHIWHFTPATHASTAAVAGMRVERIIRSPLARANLFRLDSLVGVARAERLYRPDGRSGGVYSDHSDGKDE